LFTTDSDHTGYTVVPGVAEVDTLKSVNGEGVFYLESHGGGLNSDKGDEWKNRFCAYSMMTATMPNKKNEELYKTDLEEGCLGYMWGNTELSGIVFAGWRYAITGKFVSKYMDFAPNSLVFLNGCSTDDSLFINAFFGKRASIAIGWSDIAQSLAGQDAARFLFDRLLGANQEKPESPKQRPFDFLSVWEDMRRRGLDKSRDRDPQTGEEVETASLNFRRGPGGFGLLVPSIMLLWVEEALDETQKAKLRVLGFFGNEQDSAKVNMNGNPLPIVDWSETEIICDLSGRDAGGEVVVEVRGHKSNTRWLTKWSGDFTYSDSQSWKNPNLPFRGQISAKMTVHLHFRGDVLQARASPGAKVPDYVGQVIMKKQCQGFAEGEVVKKVFKRPRGFEEVKGTMGPGESDMIHASFVLERVRNKVFIEITAAVGGIVSFTDGDSRHVPLLAMPNEGDGQEWVVSPENGAKVYLAYDFVAGTIPAKKWASAPVLANRVEHKYKFESSEIAMLSLPAPDAPV
jgi:hypothetical protein